MIRNFKKVVRATFAVKEYEFVDGYEKGNK